MAFYIDANGNFIHTTGLQSNQRDQQINPVNDPNQAPNGNGASGVPIANLQISVGGGQNYLATWSNPS